MTLNARVKAGRLVVDEPTDLPEGTEIELLPVFLTTRRPPPLLHLRWRGRLRPSAVRRATSARSSARALTVIARRW